MQYKNIIFDLGNVLVNLCENVPSRLKFLTLTQTVQFSEMGSFRKCV